MKIDPINVQRTIKSLYLRGVYSIVELLNPITKGGMFMKNANVINRVEATTYAL